jgi:hypothetical protein
MRKFYLIFLSFILLGQVILAQPPGGPGQKPPPNVEALKVAFLTRQLELTPDEAKKFWPVHDAYMDEIEKLLRENRDKKGDELELEEKMLGIRKKYKPDFVKAIGEDKFNKMLRAEREFRDMIRREMERRRAKGAGQGRQGPPSR